MTEKWMDKPAASKTWANFKTTSTNPEKIVIATMDGQAMQFPPPQSTRAVYQSSSTPGHPQCCH